MTLSRNQKIGIVVITIIVAFAFGRYTTPTKTVIQTKIVEVEKVVEKKEIDKNKNKHKKTTITETTGKNGEKTKVTIIDTVENETGKTKEEIVDNKNKNTSELTTITKSSDTVQISALGGLNLTNGKYVFGAEVSKPILGPITLGAWGLTSSEFGVSLGLRF